MTERHSFGEHIRMLREQRGLPLRKIAAALDIDPSTLSKIERGERSANREMVAILAQQFDEDKDRLTLMLVSDRVAYELLDEKDPSQILKAAEEKLRYLKTKNLQQGKIDFDKQ